MAIVTTKLTVAELCRLNTELNSEKGLLLERLPMVLKYHLSKVATIAADEQASVNRLRDEAIKSAGKITPDGNYTIEQFVETKNTKGKANKIENPAYTNFVGEMNALFSQEREISHEEFYLSDLKNVESGEVFPVFFKLLKD